MGTLGRSTCTWDGRSNCSLIIQYLSCSREVLVKRPGFKKKAKARCQVIYIYNIKINVKISHQIYWNYIVTSKADVTNTSMKQQQQYLQVSRHILVVGIFAWIRYQFWLAHPTSWVMGVVITSKSFRIQRIYMNLFHLAWLRIPFLQCIISSAWDSEMFDEHCGQGMLDVLQSKSLPTPVPSAAEPSKADSKPMSSERLREFSFFGQANSNCLSTFQINSIL